MDNQLQLLLNKQVANWTVLYMKLHNYHWFVKGRNFYRLHEKFEEFYDEAHENIDELAERILIVGGTPIATLKEALELTSIKESVGKETTEEMLKETINDFEQIVRETTEIIKYCDEVEDEFTQDMLIGLKGQVQKHIWMLKENLK